MRIGIDARSLKKQRAGIGNYIHGLVRLLPQVGPEHDYFFYSNREIDLGVSGKRVSEQIDRAFGWCPGSLWLRGRGASLARRDKLHVFWATYPILPAGIPRGVLKIVTVYDLVWLRFPETTANYALLVQKIWARKAIEKADPHSHRAGCTLLDRRGRVLLHPKKRTTSGRTTGCKFTRRSVRADGSGAGGGEEHRRAAI